MRGNDEIIQNKWKERRRAHEGCVKCNFVMIAHVLVIAMIVLVIG